MSKFYVKHSNSQVMRTAYRQYMRSDMTELYHCYNSWSHAKQMGMDRCHDMNREFNGDGCRILSYNTNFFSVGFVGEYEGKKAFFYITHAQTRFIYIDEL